jgi:hypothetical protein
VIELSEARLKREDIDKKPFSFQIITPKKSYCIFPFILEDPLPTDKVIQTSSDEELGVWITKLSKTVSNRFLIEVLTDLDI